jgi:hypothetical protein
MMSLAFWLNSAWMAKCSGELRAFHRASCRVEAAQADVLREIIVANRDTDFGHDHGFLAIASPRAFQKRVPLSNYENCRDAISRIAAGEPHVLTRAPVRLLEPTGGSSGGEKWIPYTDGLRHQFQRGIAAWIADLFRHRPAVRRGRAYWSISPALGPSRRTTGGIPIGFDDDAAYLGGVERWALRRLLVAPSGLARCDDLEMFRNSTLLYLLAAEDLALISIWSPTFLTALLQLLPERLDRLCHDLRRGSRTKWFSSVAANPRRADAVVSIAKSSADMPEMLREMWPGLELISCWADAAAAHGVGEMRQLFPHVEIQPKGLLATEGIVSIPLIDSPAPALAVRSHFFEFAEAASDDVAGGDAAAIDARHLRLAHQLDRGGRYRIVLTTAGGLYRYCLGDEVEIVGHRGEYPLLRFLGRGDRVSDLVGEKLSEPHVRLAVDGALARCGLAARFAMLTPVAVRPARYRFYLQLADGAETGTSAIATLQRALEAGLAENPHYRYAVGLGQLAPVEIQLLDARGEPAWHLYQQRCLARGQKFGNIKPVALDTWDGWPEAFGPPENDAPRPTPAGKPIAP